MTLSSPHVHLLQESNYFTPQGEFRVDSGGSQTLLNCLMYKLCYYRFGEVQVSTITYEYTPHNAISEPLALSNPNTSYSNAVHGPFFFHSVGLPPSIRI